MGLRQAIAIEIDTASGKQRGSGGCDSAVRTIDCEQSKSRGTDWRFRAADLQSRLLVVLRLFLLLCPILSFLSYGTLIQAWNNAGCNLQVVDTHMIHLIPTQAARRMSAHYASGNFPTPGFDRSSKHAVLTRSDMDTLKVARAREKGIWFGACSRFS